MTGDQKDRSARSAEQRLEAFLDCVARLMAKRWLREQQDEPQEACEEIEKDEATE